MENVNLKRVWEILNTLEHEETKLSKEEDKWVRLLGGTSGYCVMDFEIFLEYYSFKIDDDRVVIFNDDSIAYEDFNNSDFSYIPSVLLSFSAEKLKEWITTEIERQLEQQDKDKVAKKENLKLEVERLTKQLNNL